MNKKIIAAYTVLLTANFTLFSAYGLGLTRWPWKMRSEIHVINGTGKDLKLNRAFLRCTRRYYFYPPCSCNATFTLPGHQTRTLSKMGNSNALPLPNWPTGADLTITTTFSYGPTQDCQVYLQAGTASEQYGPDVYFTSGYSKILHEKYPHPSFTATRFPGTTQLAPYYIVPDYEDLYQFSVNRRSALVLAEYHLYKYQGIFQTIKK